MSARIYSVNQGIALETEQLGKQFHQRAVLNALDLHIPAGQFVAVVGRSGCGKSTLLRLFAGLEKPSGGKLLSGIQPLHHFHQDIRLMFQDDRLLPWKKVIENVGIGLSGDWKPKAREALESVGLAGREDDWPSALSGGQKQRVALARALIHRPRLLLLDEPLGALDALTRIEMQQLIERLWLEQGFTVLLVTHDVSEAVSIADRVILIEEGAIGLDLTVDLSRPRQRGLPRLAALENEVLEHIFTRHEVGSEQPGLHYNKGQQ
ncbi:aliphatic sulfonates ABC transporter ATP-binding protein (plasmid) [Klebsiella sp. WOUb02]|uniref:aliphatic sulfonates ABC transporter ATP-binding protein n=1 Tax=Klebsiella sp. WOUb02 TaxID=3161071 RepID=UPI003CE90F9C